MLKGRRLLRENFKEGIPVSFLQIKQNKIFEIKWLKYKRLQTDFSKICLYVKSVRLKQEQTL